MHFLLADAHITGFFWAQDSICHGDAVLGIQMLAIGAALGLAESDSEGLVGMELFDWYGEVLINGVDAHQHKCHVLPTKVFDCRVG